MILVTGGAGFVGAELVDALVDRGYYVRVLDWFIYEEYPFKRGKEEKIEILKGDIRDLHTVRQAMNGIDSVIHLAAISNDPSADLDAKLTWQINYEGTINLLTTAKEMGVKRFINASSASVYGINESLNVNESTETKPITCYAETKSQAETRVLSENSSQFTTVSLRPATLVGYSKRLRLDLVANIFTYQAMLNGKITILGGSQKRPLLAIEDMIDIYLELLVAPADLIGGHSFNVSETNYEVIEIGQMVASLVEKPVEIAIQESNDNRSYHLNSEKIKAVLNWEPSFGIRHSLLKLIRNFENGNIPDPGNNKYRNIKMMQDISLVW
ncbi:NAD-dependent epimerase/dehydratase family protein [Paenibacillus humicus]|uniref:NAD-dependent epimerase/dehydratase family protein n=1 Tax=Paenibacillus humicus TaxID=412861 RepID=UPI003D28A228